MTENQVIKRNVSIRIWTTEVKKFVLFEFHSLLAPISIVSSRRIIFKFCRRLDCILNDKLCDFYKIVELHSLITVRFKTSDYTTSNEMRVYGYRRLKSKSVVLFEFHTLLAPISTVSSRRKIFKFCRRSDWILNDKLYDFYKIVELHSLTTMRLKTR